jgi:hypothetical protein
LRSCCVLRSAAPAGGRNKGRGATAERLVRASFDGA